MRILGALAIPGVQMLNFTLTYDGPIPSGGKGSHVEEKQKMRRAFHPQLRAWWETGPLAETLKNLDKTMYQAHLMSRVSVESGIQFVPIVTKWLNVVCELDILMLKPEEAGRFIRNDGDIDNRLKILFDALRVPQNRDEIPQGGREYEEEPRCYCLLEDDALITKVSIRADRLLAQHPDPSAVRLIIGVSVRATHLTNGNFPIGT